ncbi:DUF742 domain-containing protein [Streptomyces roseus]|uniref:DUF742 domain-containing protein n=1 Tax=Streptomyces roseus TaxID=66430 RepID=UPI00131B50EA|nr:DUF742 domain-containing protein [Streptomyces roseus]
MRVDDVLAELKPEHFTSGKVPSRTTVSERLAGIGVQDDFVQALADICSRDVRSRERLMHQVKELREQTLASPHKSQNSRASGESLAAELVIVQKRSLDVSDKLTRAMERVTELERERNSANHMVLLLLAMVDKLQRDIAILARQRDRLHTATSEMATHDVETRLLQSERQRTTAESELKRAQEERSRADLLAAEAAEQVRVLSIELDRLRGQLWAPEAEQLPESSLQTIPEVPGNDSADIDEALAKAAHHLDDRSGRLDRLAEEMSRDNLPDNPPSSGVPADNWLTGVIAPRGSYVNMHLFERPQGRNDDPKPQQAYLQDLARESVALGPSGFVHSISELRATGSGGVVDEVIRLVGKDSAPAAIGPLLTALLDAELDADYSNLVAAVGRLREPIGLVFEVLRQHGLTDELHAVLAAVGGERHPSQVPFVLDDLNEDERDWVLAAAGRRPLHELRMLLNELESLGRKREAARLGAQCWYRIGGERVRQEETEAPSTRRVTQQPRAEEGDSHDVSRSRPLPMYGLPISTLVRAAIGADLSNRSMAHHRVYASCENPTTISNLALGLGLPFEHTTKLVVDLLNDGALEAPGTSE